MAKIELQYLQDDDMDDPYFDGFIIRVNGEPKYLTTYEDFSDGAFYNLGPLLEKILSYADGNNEIVLHEKDGKFCHFETEEETGYEILNGDNFDTLVLVE